MGCFNHEHLLLQLTILVANILNEVSAVIIPYLILAEKHLKNCGLV